MPAGRPRLNRTNEEAREAQLASKRRYARRARLAERLLQPSRGSGTSRVDGSKNISPVSTPDQLLPGTSLPASIRPATPEAGLQSSLADLKLLHHFTVATSVTLSDLPDIVPVWQIEVPCEAFKHQFLLSGILAISALHLAYLHPQEAGRHHYEASLHQNNALRLFRPAMLDVTPINCNALFALAALLVILAFASPTKKSGALVLVDSESSGNEWFRLVRGSAQLLEPMWEWIIAGPLAPLCRQGPVDDATDSSTSPATEAREYLSAFAEHFAQYEDEAEVRNACASAVNELQTCFVRLTKSSPPSSHVNSVMSWPVKVPQSYVVLLEQRNPSALIILAYYSVALRSLDHLWWIQGWATRILLTVQDLLGDDHQAWLDWPLRVAS